MSCHARLVSYVYLLASISAVYIVRRDLLVTLLTPSSNEITLFEGTPSDSNSDLVTSIPIIDKIGSIESANGIALHLLGVIPETPGMNRNADAAVDAADLVMAVDEEE